MKKGTFGKAPFTSLYLLFGLGGLARSVSEIIEFGASDLTFSDDFDFFDVGRMDREGLFDADAVRYSAYLEGLGDAAAASRDNGAFINLDSLSRSLFDLKGKTYRITYFERGDIGFQLLFGKFVDNVVHFCSSVFPRHSCRALQRTARVLALILYRNFLKIASIFLHFLIKVFSRRKRAAIKRIFSIIIDFILII